jgi:hypothetical protein
MKPEGLLLCSQKTTSGPHFDPDKLIQILPLCLFKIH